jgi:TPR repeat protein
VYKQTLIEYEKSAQEKCKVKKNSWLKIITVTIILLLALAVIYPILNETVFNDLSAKITQGDAAAQSQLALLENNIPAPSNKDPNKSLNELLEMATQGNVDAQYELGRYYFNEKNYLEAYEWWKKATEQGHTEAQKMLVFLKSNYVVA